MVYRGAQSQRTCLGCGARDDPKGLLRLTVTEEGRLIVDRHRGRGGYLHRDELCWRKFLARKGLYRAFRVEVSREAREQLVRELKSRNWE